MPTLVEEMERSGQLQLTAELRAGLLGMSAATMDRALQETRGSGEARKRAVSSTVAQRNAKAESSGRDSPSPGITKMNPGPHREPSTMKERRLLAGLPGSLSRPDRAAQSEVGSSPPARLPDCNPGTDAEMLDIIEQVLGASKQIDASLKKASSDWIESKLRIFADITLNGLKKKAASPNIREELDRLDEIHKLSRNLQRKLAALDDITRALLKIELDFLEHSYSSVEPKSDSLLSVALTRNMALQSRNNVVHPLETLAQAIQGTRSFIARRGGSQSGLGIKRGPVNLHGHFISDLRIRLTYKCAMLLEEYQGAEAVKSTEGGKLYNLASALWRYSVGTEIASGGEGGMSSVVKRVAPVAQRVFQMLKTTSSGAERYHLEEKAKRELYHPRPMRRRQKSQGSVSLKDDEMLP